jgi:hypothetical protein
MAMMGSLASPSPGQDEPKKDYSIWKIDLGVGVCADAAMLHAFYAAGLERNGFGILGTRVLLGKHKLLVETDWHFDFDKVPPLDPRALKLIEDHHPLPNVFRKDPTELKRYELGWYAAYNEAIRFTHVTTEDQFKNSAKKLENVAYPRLKAMPEKYRGKIITVKGKLAVLREEEAPRYAGPGIDHIYTGWIMNPTERAPPYVVALTELPDGLKVSEKVNQEVEFVGYFLSLVKFPPDKGGSRAQKDAGYPYLVGKIVSVLPPEKAPPLPGPTGTYAYFYIVSILGGFTGIAVLLAVLNIWLRRGDRQTQAQLQELRERQNPFSLEPADEPATAPADTPPPDPQGPNPH